jgi:hypothetical protein
VRRGWLSGNMMYKSTVHLPSHPFHLLSPNDALWKKIAKTKNDPLGDTTLGKL